MSLEIWAVREFPSGRTPAVIHARRPHMPITFCGRTFDLQPTISTTQMEAGKTRFQDPELLSPQRVSCNICREYIEEADRQSAGAQSRALQARASRPNYGNPLGMLLGLAIIVAGVVVFFTSGGHFIWTGAVIVGVLMIIRSATR